MAQHIVIDLDETVGQFIQGDGQAASRLRTLFNLPETANRREIAQTVKKAFRGEIAIPDGNGGTVEMTVEKT